MQPTISAIKHYTIDENHSTVRFWVRHLMISKVHGEISDVTGTVDYNADDPSASKIDVKLGVESLTTKQAQRDAHLKSTDFLESEQFPTITFQSNLVEPKGDGEFEIEGILNIHGVTKPVTFRAEASPEISNPYGGFKVGVSASGVINREEFGITWNQTLETGGVMIGKDIHFEIDLELDRPA